MLGISDRNVSSKNKSDNMSAAETSFEDLRSIVVNAMEPHMATGKAYAQAKAALTLGLSVRRVRSYWERTVGLIPYQEADRLRAWHNAWKHKQVERLDHEMNLIKARKAKMDVWKNV